MWGAMNVKLYQHGVCLTLQDPDRDTEKKGGGKRGKLNGQFSSASFRRLRTFCITSVAPGACWGVTLTIPGLSVVRYEYVSTWLHRLTQWANFRKIPLIWRVELQQRGQAHFHIVMYGQIHDVLRLCCAWQKQVSSSGKCLNVERLGDDDCDCVWINRAYIRGSAHMFDVQRLLGDFSTWRYLVAHQSKAKQAQSGWPGRQWGVCYRSGFSRDEGFTIDLSDAAMYYVRRWIRRLTRQRRINSIGRHFLLVSPVTVDRFVSYAQYLTQDQPF